MFLFPFDLRHVLLRGIVEQDCPALFGPLPHVLCHHQPGLSRTGSGINFTHHIYNPGKTKHGNCQHSNKHQFFRFFKLAFGIMKKMFSFERNDLC